MVQPSYVGGSLGPCHAYGYLKAHLGGRHVTVYHTQGSRRLAMWSQARDPHWAPTPMPTPISTHAHGFWVGMGAIFKFMGGHSCDIIVYGWAWVGMVANLLGMGGHGFDIIMGGHGLDIIVHGWAWANKAYWKGSLNELWKLCRRKQLPPSPLCKCWTMNTEHPTQALRNTDLKCGDALCRKNWTERLVFLLG